MSPPSPVSVWLKMFFVFQDLVASNRKPLQNKVKIVLTTDIEMHSLTENLIRPQDAGC